MIWHRSWRADPAGAALADRHYNRQKVGAPQFVPPGRCVVLRTLAADALWVTSWPLAEYVKHQWAGAWVNSCFRNESPGLSSAMIREAVAATRSVWPDVPPQGLITFVDVPKVRAKRNPGYCYLCAGFRLVGETLERGMLAFQLLPADMPDACAPVAEIPRIPHRKRSRTTLTVPASQET